MVFFSDLLPDLLSTDVCGLNFIVFMVTCNNFTRYTVFEISILKNKNVRHFETAQDRNFKMNIYRTRYIINYLTQFEISSSKRS